MGLLFFVCGSWFFWSWRYIFIVVFLFVDRLLEKGIVLFYYFWFVGIVCYFFFGWKLLVWMVVIEFMFGMLLGFVFVFSYNGMEVYNLFKEFVSV